MTFEAKIDETLLGILVCPADRGPLLLVNRGSDALLYNPRLRRAYRIEDGIPVLLLDEAVGGPAADEPAEQSATGLRASLEFTAACQWAPPPGGMAPCSTTSRRAETLRATGPGTP